MQTKAETFEKTIVLLVAIAPLIIPFGLVRNIGLQAFLISLTGLLAWAAIYLRRPRLDRTLAIILACYVLACIASTLGNWQFVTVFGAPLSRLGAVELLACVGIGLALRRIPTMQLALYLYTSTCALAIASVPYTLLHYHHLVRIGGLFYQPDFLAIVLTVGFIIGNSLWRHHRYQYLLVALQAWLLVVIFLTQTRAVIAIAAIVTLLQIWLSAIRFSRKILFVGLFIVMVSAGFLLAKQLPTNRLTDGSFAAQSVSYRLDLQRAAMHHLTNRPLVGYGAGNITKPLACKGLTAPALVRTCRDHYYFDSSHNLFIDRFLALGWLGGISFAMITILLVWRGLRAADKTFALAALAVMLYYVTNIASIEIELLLWITLLHNTNAKKLTSISDIAYKELKALKLNRKPQPVKRLKLNSQGVAHHFLLALIIVGVAVGGSYYLIRSFADTQDGSLAVVRYGHSPVIMNQAGIVSATLSGITPNDNPQDLTWSADGTQLAFTLDTLNATGTKYTSRTLYTINADGSDRKQIINMPNVPEGQEGNSLMSPTWSADGKTLYFTYQDLLYSVPVGGGTATKLAQAGRTYTNPTVSPDGKSILSLEQPQESGDGHWTIHDIATGNETPLPDLDKPFAWRAAWSPDGASIYTMANGNQDSCTITQFTSAGELTKTLLSTQSYQCQSLTVSPSGDTLALITLPTNTGDYNNAEVRTMPSDGGTVTEVPNTAVAVGISWGKAKPATTPVTAPVTAPTAPAKPAYAAACTITNIAASYTTGQSLSAYVRLQNTGTSELSPQISYTLTGPRGSLGTHLYTSRTLSAGASTTTPLARYTLPAAGTYTLTATSNTKDVPFTCTRSFQAISLTYIASCSITGVPNKVKLNKQFNPVVTMQNTGTGRVQMRNITLTTNPNVGATSTKSKSFNLFLNPGQSSSKQFSDKVVNSNKKIPSSVVIKARIVADTSNNVSCSKTVKVVR